MIEGQTDYKYGRGNVAFDSCELRWKGYNTESTRGYITAGLDDNYKGYFMYNCKVTKKNPLLLKKDIFVNLGELMI